MKVKSFYLVAVLMLTACFSFNSCGGKDSDPAGSVTLEVTGYSDEAVSFTGADVKITVAVSDQNADWKLESSETWAALDPLRGTGNGKFTVKVSANPNEQERTAKITIYLADNKSVKKEFTITQAALSADWEWTVSGIFAEKCVGIKQFSFGDPNWIIPSLYYKHTLLKKGTLTFEFTNSHIHIFFADKEPGYFANLGDMTFTEEETVPREVEIYPEGIIKKDASGSDYGRPNGAGDVTPLCPRGDALKVSFRLNAGTYWSTHSLEENGTEEKPECADPKVEGNFDPFTENFTLKVTFKAD